MRPPAVPLDGRHLGPEMAQHALGVVARRLRLDDRGGAARMQSGDQDGRLDLRRRHRQAVLDRNEVRRAAQGQRQPDGAVQHLDAHPLQRIEHARHRPLRQRGIARHAHRHVVARDQAHHQARAGAGVAEIEFAVRLRPIPRRRAPAPPRYRPVFRIGQPSACSALAVLSTSSASSSPVMRGAAGGDRPEHQGPVRDRLVARHPDPPRQGGRSGRRQGLGMGVRHGLAGPRLLGGGRHPAAGWAAIEQARPALSTKPPGKATVPGRSAGLLPGAARPPAICF